MHNRAARLLLFSLIMLLSVAPIEAKRKKKTTSPQVVRTQLAPADARRLSYFYQEAIKQKLNGHLSEAYDLFQHCLSIDSEDPDALYETGYLSFYLGQDSVGTALFRRAAEIDNQNPRYIQSLAAAYLSRNEQELAIPVLERLSQLQTRRSDVLYQLMELYKSNGKTEDAIRALDRIELLEGRSLQTALQKYALYVDRGRQEDAYNVLKGLERESPYDMRIPIILGRRYLENQDAEHALECFDRVAKTEPKNADLLMAMMEYYEQTGQKERRYALRDSLLYAPGSSDEVRAQMASVLIYDLREQPDHRQRILQVLDSLIDIRRYGYYIPNSKVKRIFFGDGYSEVLWDNPNEASLDSVKVLPYKLVERILLNKENDERNRKKIRNLLKNREFASIPRVIQEMDEYCEENQCDEMPDYRRYLNVLAVLYKTGVLRRF